MNLKASWNSLKTFWSNVQTHMNEYLDAKKIAHDAPKAEGKDKALKIGGQIGGGFVGWQVVGFAAGLLSFSWFPALIVDYIGVRSGMKIVKNAQDIRNAAPAEARPSVLESLGTSSAAFGSGFVGALKDVFKGASSNDNNGQSNNNSAPKNNTTTQTLSNKR